MSNEITMSVSGMTRTGDNKAVYVLFEDNGKSAEIAIPGCTVISNNGFSITEINQLKEYVDNEQDQIYSLAKTVNPMRALMK